ncbi:MAG: hypothetical protein HOW97_01540, partial [Catenulispora sp.]|nr:hypothetical protein [Catenulispora sp.]
MAEPAGVADPGTVAREVLGRAREAVEPVMRSAVATLPGRMGVIGAYHLGWVGAEGAAEGAGPGWLSGGDGGEVGRDGAGSGRSSSSDTGRSAGSSYSDSADNNKSSSSFSDSGDVGSTLSGGSGKLLRPGLVLAAATAVVGPAAMAAALGAAEQSAGPTAAEWPTTADWSTMAGRPSGPSHDPPSARRPGL